MSVRFELVRTVRSWVGVSLAALTLSVCVSASAFAAESPTPTAATAAVPSPGAVPAAAPPKSDGAVPAAPVNRTGGGGCQSGRRRGVASGPWAVITAFVVFVGLWLGSRTGKGKGKGPKGSGSKPTSDGSVPLAKPKAATRAGSRRGRKT